MNNSKHDTYLQELQKTVAEMQRNGAVPFLRIAKLYQDLEAILREFNKECARQIYKN